MLSGTESKTRVEAESPKRLLATPARAKCLDQSIDAELEHSCSYLETKHKKGREQNNGYMAVRTTAGGDGYQPSN